MAGVSDKSTVTMAGWPAGIDNMSPEYDLQRDDKGRAVIAFRDANNVDLIGIGKPRRREGFQRILDAMGTHSLWRGGNLSFGIYAVGGQLRGFRPGGAFDITDGLTPGARVSYALAADRVYWSNSRERGVVLADGEAAPWGCPCPYGQPMLAVQAGQGGLAAGNYQVAITWQLDTGEESGAAPAVAIDIPDGAGIALTNFPLPPDGVAKVRVYVSGANGDVLYHAIDLAPGLPAALIGQGRRGKPLDTMFLEQMPAGQFVRWMNGRLYVAAGDTLVWSEALRYGLTHPANNRLGFRARMSMLEAVGAGGEAPGLYVADDHRTYWLDGADPASFRPKIVYPAPAIPGTSLMVSGKQFELDTPENVAYWIAADGVACLGLPGGVVIPLRKQYTVAPSASAGASIYRERNGAKQVVTALQESQPRGVRMGDSAVITVERYDA